MVCIVPPSQNVPAGSLVQLDVVIDGVTDLGAYGIEVQYDPSLLTFVSATDSGFLGSSGRTVQCLPVLMKPPAPATPTSFVLSCGTFGAVGQSGANGTGILFHVTFQATALTGTSPLTLGPPLKFDVLDPSSVSIPAAAVSGSVTLQ